jgi:hypothetical protein
MVEETHRFVRSPSIECVCQRVVRPTSIQLVFDRFDFQLLPKRRIGFGGQYEPIMGPTQTAGHRQVVDLVWHCQDWSVAIAATYKGYRYPIEVIGHAVWLYHRFALSLRDVEELMLARGVVLTYETIRSWCARFGPDYANKLRRRRPRPGDKWHLDEVFVKINGTTHYLWRADTVTLVGVGALEGSVG